MIILGVFTAHDAGAALFDDYRMIAAVSLERLTRMKSDGDRFPDEAIDDCLACVGLGRTDVDVLCLPRGSYPARYVTGKPWWDLRSKRPPRFRRGVLREMVRHGTNDPMRVFDTTSFLADSGFRPGTSVHFYNHHFAHALGALFHTDWDDALLYTADGEGDRVFYSARHMVDGRIEDIFGGDRASLAWMRHQQPASSVALLYADITEALGFMRLRHEGKVLGLAALGEPRFAPFFRDCFRVDASGRVRGRRSPRAWQDELVRLAAREPREDIAASVQRVVEEVAVKAIGNVLEKYPARRLGVAGGLFANVLLNQKLAETLPLDEIFVYPAMSDQGMAAGGALSHLLTRDGLTCWLAKRWRFDTLYYGRDHSARAARAFSQGGAVRIDQGDVVAATVKRIREGEVVGTYLGRMEYGPRALGARSILGSAIDRTINDSLNKRLLRSEFMPFAPVVRAERANDVFNLPSNLAYTANFMTTTCSVKPEWRERIPAVVHVDGTARPQVVHRAQNPIYYDILARYEAATGLPVLINTSFNVHEEPIINTPEECMTALADNRVDAVVSEGGVWAMPHR